MNDQNRHALVIGAQTHGLRGPERDAAVIGEVLTERGFTVDLRVGSNATRAGILDGYDRLIGRMTRDGAAVVYFAGHGTLAYNQEPSDRIRHVQAIVPTDLDPEDPADFRGITSWELAIKLAQLSARTQNVTVLLDCCHAAQMSRDGAARQAVPRALPHPTSVAFRRHLAALEALYGPVELDPVGNPDAVRLVACAQTESAVEYLDAAGQWIGAFTEALIKVLGEVEDLPISWAAVGEAVRERVVRRFITQRPEIEGPSHRRVFSLAAAERTRAVRIEVRDDRIRIHTGQLLGEIVGTVGDVYGVMPDRATTYDDTTAIATLRVTEIAPLTSIAQVAQWKNRHTSLPQGAVAIPIQVAAPVHPVVVIAPEAERGHLADAIAATPTLQIASRGDTAIARLRLADRQLTIEDPAGPLFPPTRYPEDLADTIKNVANLAVAQSVRDLVGEHGLSAARLEISWGVVENGEPRPMPDHGASLGLGDRIYVKVRNTGYEPRYIHIFNVGVRGRVTLLTRNLALSGIGLDSTNPELVLGERDGKLTGLPISWPRGLPRDSFPRTDEIFVFVTAQRISLRNLETQEYAVRGVKGTPGGSKLQELLAQRQDGLTRDVGDSEPLEGFFVKRLSYVLHPREAAMADTVAYELDDNPRHRAAGRSADAWLTGSELARRGARSPAPSPVPSAIAIRIGELVVEHNRAMFSADVRIDALVCTRATDQAEAYTAHTMRYQGIKDGERLPLEHARIFQGPVRDFVDICLWVSRDTKDSRSLSELFAQHTSSPQFHDAATALLATAHVPAAPWITAVGASAVLARMAYDLILTATGRTIGLYRTSFLADERFGVGRHPAKDRHRAQDFSFSLLIDATPSPPA